jgi:asparagine synthase (glutamine-hydrolysing)
MCGFAGFLTATPFAPEALLEHAQRMAATLVHRGPDDGGAWADAASGVALGFRRLAILDLSPNGHQPMHSPSGRFTAVFNGEVYNFRDLRRELEDHGFAFRGGSDTEVLLAAFEWWGIREALRRVLGMFAIGVWDARRRELTLVRDRIGKKPLYVYTAPGLISFASELKALAAGPQFDRTVDGGALASYLRYLYVPAPRSIFERVTKLLPAHLLTIADPSQPLPAPEPYWSLRQKALDGLAHAAAGASEADAIDELDGLLSDAVRCRLEADVPLGALLSGGIDSSTVVALMQEAGGRPVRTFTIGFDDERFDEADHASAVARHLGTDHTGLRLAGGDALALVPRMPEIFDEPLADPSQLPTLLVSQLARRHVTVALCGDGGDELFGGYNRYVYGTRVLPRVSRLPRVVRRSVAAGIRAVPAGAWDGAERCAAAVLPGAALPRAGERAHKLGALMSEDSIGAMYRSLVSAWQSPDDLLLGRDSVARAGDILERDEPADLLDRMMLADQAGYLPDDLLAKVDRASMAVGLEVRAPLLDHRVVEFSWRLPRSLKLRGGQGKWALRQVLHRRVPARLVERPKMGFSVPIDRWLRGPLREWASDLLSPASLRDGGLNPPAIGRAWGQLLSGARPAGPAVWAVLMYQAWRTRWAA